MILWLLTSLAIAGAILNIKRHRAGFYCWAITNTAWAFQNCLNGDYPQAVQYAVFLGFSIWGILEWRK